MAGVQMTHVPYKSSAAALTGLIAGQVQLRFETAPNALTHYRAGRVCALGVSTAKRSAAAPESSPEHLAAFMQTGIAKRGKIVRDTGAKVD